MTQEEKAKAYDEALNWMRELYPGLHGATKEDAEHYFPELRESEDERIRKEIIKFIQDFCNPCGPDCDKWIAYLEKQKENPKNADSISADCASLAKCEDRNSKYGVFPEDVIVVARACEKLEVHGYTELAHALKNVNLYTKKPVDYDHEMWKNCEANFEGGKKEVIDHPEKYGLQKEQKPAEWSEEDKRAIDRACVALRAYSNGDLPEFLPSELLGYADRLQSLRPQSHWKKSLATADLENSLCDLQDNYHDGSNEYKVLGEAIEFIRCTEPRPSWKPSEEQMNYLCAAVDAAIRKHNESVSGYKPARVLKSLYEDLQKLM